MFAECSEYAKLVTQTVSAVPLSITSQISSTEVPDCPKEAVELIVGGQKAALGEFPHMVIFTQINQSMWISPEYTKTTFL